MQQARSRTRTDDPLLTMEVLYQLSYPGGGLTIAPSPALHRRRGAYVSASERPAARSASSGVAYISIRSCFPSR